MSTLVPAAACALAGVDEKGTAARSWLEARKPGGLGLGTLQRHAAPTGSLRVTHPKRARAQPISADAVHYQPCVLCRPLHQLLIPGTETWQGAAWAR